MDTHTDGLTGVAEELFRPLALLYIMAHDGSTDEAISNALLDPEGTKAQIEQAADLAEQVGEGRY